MAGYTAKQRFALALAAPITTELRVEPDPGRGRAELDDYLGDRAEFTAIEESTAGSVAIAARVYSLALACRIEQIDVATAWEQLAQTAHAAQAQYASWDDYAAPLGTKDLGAARRLWATVPWDTEIDASSHWAAVPLRQRFAIALGAPYLCELDPRRLGGWGFVTGQGNEVVGDQGGSLLAAHGIRSRADLIEWTKPKIRGDADDLARVSQIVGTAAVVYMLSEEDAWNILLLAAKQAQLQYSSWVAFGAACKGDTVRARDVWADVPWNLELGVTIVDPSQHIRVLAVSCPACGAPRMRPSATAYVYCDACGSLVDYDFSVALATPLAQPGPVYERLHGQLATELSATRERGDRDGYRALQRRLFGAWLEACPQAAPVRVKDASYREAHIAWLAEAQVVADFDDEARAREAAMHRAVGQLQFIAAGAAIRVPTDKFRVLASAYFDYETRRDELFQEAGVYALHPEKAPRDLQRRIGFSAFAQAWLPMLEAGDAAWILEKTGLSREYRLLPPTLTHQAECTHCGGPLAILEGAKRVVCDHCGRLSDVVGST